MLSIQLQELNIIVIFDTAYTCMRRVNPSSVLVQPRKTRPFITERLLMGRKESNQTKSNKSNIGLFNTR